MTFQDRGAEKQVPEELSRKTVEVKQALDGAMTDGEEEIFAALDELAVVVLSLRARPETEREATRLDRVGEQMVGGLIRKLSLKSAQIEELTRELSNLRKAWGDQLKTAE